MNFDNSIATLFFGNASSVQAAANPNGAVVADGSGNSLFQQMIVQMLASGSFTAATGLMGSIQGNGDSGEEPLLGQLMTGEDPGALMAALGLSAGEAEGLLELTEGFDAAASDEDAQMELLAMMLGAAGVAPVLNSGRISYQTEILNQDISIKTSVDSLQNPGVNLAKTAYENMNLNLPYQTSKAAEQNPAAIAAQNQAAVAAQENIQGSGTQASAKSAGQGNPNQALTDNSGLAVMTEEPITPEADLKTGSKAEDSQTALSESKNFEKAITAAESNTEEPQAKEFNKVAAELQNPQGTASTTGTTEQNLIKPAESPEPHSQIRNEILTKLDQKGPTEFSMQLEPEDLGKIDINLKLSEGRLIIDILAANSRTHTLLTNQVDKLIAGMGLQNVQVESVNVSQQMNPQSQDSSQGQQYSMNAAMDFSKRGQQEQLRDEAGRNQTINAASILQNQEQESAATGQNGLYRSNSHRMNYVV